MKPNTLPLACASLAVATAAFATAAFAIDSVEPPKAEPRMQQVLEQFAALDGKPIETLSPAEARRQPTPADAVGKLLKEQDRKAAAAGITVKQRSIDGPLGKIPLHVYTPAGKGPFPVLLYYHGGGFVMADTKTYDASIRALARGANAVVVSADYHRAPEHKFPAAPNDAFTAYRWVLANAADINGDPERVAVAGESAGGNLAAVVALMARDRKVQAPVHQLLIYPVVGDDMSTPSYQRNANAKPLNKPMMQWFFKQYTNGPDDAQNPYALPLKADTLKDLPAATVITAEIDPLATEGERYAERLKKDGVKVDSRQFDGVTHEFFGMAPAVPKAEDAQKLAIANLKKAFGTR